MKKDEVYKIINYNGVYDAEVKKNLKNLIKKYHPDKNKKDKKTIQVIYEVKKELENNKVSYKPKKKEVKNKQDFISEEECIKNINRLEKNERRNNKELNELYDQLSNLFKTYREKYQKICLTKNQLCSFSDDLRKLVQFNIFFKVLILIFVLLLIFCIIFSNLFLLIISIIVLLFIIVEYIWYSKKIILMRKKISNISNKIENKAKEISLIQDKIKELSDHIHELERKNNCVKNDIRFYKNMKDK